ncbi:3'-5' exonuclease [Mycolicibacterium brisbanense]
MRITFIDTETLGLAPDAPIWEFAAVSRFDDGSRDDSTKFFIHHDPGDWVETLPESFQADYRNRYEPRDALDEQSAAAMIHFVTRGAELVACNPVFDEPRLAGFLRRHGIEPEWHYHPWDIASVALGFICGRDGRPPGRPWKSDRLAHTVGLDNSRYKRHTAMGDVRWTLAQWDAIVGGGR